MDDHFEHTLRLYKDRDSGGIRLLASVLGGHMKKSYPFPKPRKRSLSYPEI